MLTTATNINNLDININKYSPTNLIATVAVGGNKGGVGGKEGEVRKSARAGKVDAVLADFGGLINDEFKAWYAKAAYAVGVEKFAQLASQAKEGHHPTRLFSWLLKQEMANA